jgi:hypothetical protein
MYVTMSISTGLCPDWDLWTANKLQLQLQLQGNDGSGGSSSSSSRNVIETSKQQ